MGAFRGSIAGLAGLVCLVLAAPRHAAAGSLAGAFVNNPISVRQAGMGGLSIGQSDVLCAWSNPAVLGFQEATGAFAIGGFSPAVGDGTLIGAAGSWMFLPGTVVAGLYSGSSASPSGSSGALAFAFRADDPVAAGVSVRGISEPVLGGTATAMGVDAGVVASVAGFRGGVSARNVGRPHLSAPGIDPGTDHVPSEVRVGASWTHAPQRITVGAEFWKVDGGDASFGGGAQWWPIEAAGIRAGGGSAGGESMVTAGLSGVLGPVRIDYAYVNRSAGGDHLFSVSYLFGAGAKAVATASRATAPAAKPVKKPQAKAKPESVRVKAPTKPVKAAKASEAAKAAPVDLDAEYNAGKALYKAGRYAAARDKLEAVVATGQADWKILALLGNSYFGLGDKDKALAAYAKSLELNPGNSDLRAWVEKMKKGE